METAAARFLGVIAGVIALLALPANAGNLNTGNRPPVNSGEMWHHGGHRSPVIGLSGITVPGPVYSRNDLATEPVVQPVYVPVFFPVAAFAPVQRSASYGHRWLSPLRLPAAPKIIEVQPPRRAVYLLEERDPLAGGYRPRWQRGLRAASVHIYVLD